MEKKIVIDLQAYRQAEMGNLSPPDGVTEVADRENGLKNIRELAVFRFSCRKCSDAPCIAVCPPKALEKGNDGVILRAVNLCISCKSCVMSCPFGTLMTDFFRFKRDKSDVYDLTDEKSLEVFLRKSPAGTVAISENEEIHDPSVHRLNERVLVRELTWDSV